MPITPAQAKNSQTGALQESGLTSGQATFAEELSAKTGLSPALVGAWELAEESGGAAQSYQSESFNDWLNVGIPSASGAMHSDAVWKNPVSAADATAAWMMGKDSIPGYGTASGGIQKILGGNLGDPQSVISAIGSSGWGTDAANISSIYSRITNQHGALANAANAVTGPLVAGGNAASAIPNAVSAGAGEVSSIWSALTNPHNWLRGLEIVAAVLAIYFAFRSLTGTDPAAVITTPAKIAAARG